MTEVVRVACPHDCPDTCAMLVTVEDGVAKKIQGDPSMPFTEGTLCTKVAHYLERTYAPDRLLYPQKRIGPKGRGLFKRISWDEALDEIAARLKAVAAENPESILPCSYAGTMGMVQYSSMDRRFFHKLGASLLDRTLCSSAGKFGLKATLGGSVGMDPERFDEAKLIILWGANPVVSNLHLWSRVQDAKRRGAKVIAIDPYRSLSAEKCTQHVALLPGSDGALALAMMHVLISEDLLDHDYIERHTLGYEDLRKKVLQNYSPQWAAQICGLAVQEIVQLAREYATIKPAAIRLNYGMQRHAGGGIAARTIACLPALVGAWREAGGGALLSTSGTFPVNEDALQRPDLVRPGTRTLNMSQLGRALLDTKLAPPVQALFVYNSNPVAVAPDSARVTAGFARDDLFCVVHEIFQTDTADYADILLPATTQLEQTDIHHSYGHLYAQANNPAIAPRGEAKPNTEVFRLLAARMGFTEACFSDDDDTLARQAFRRSDPRAAGFDWPTMQARGFQRLAVPAVYAPFARGNFPTPSGKCELYSAWLEQQGLDPLPFYNPPAEGGDEALAERYPLAFLSPPARHFLNSTFANLARFREFEREPHLDMHPEDATRRGIADGDRVRLFNDRGSYTLKARVNAKPRPGVVVAPSVWWKKHAPDGRNANDVTSQRTADLGGGATFYDCRVQVERLS